MLASVGCREAWIVKITEEAGVGLGAFYLYFEGEQAIFDEVVEDLNRRVRHAMTDAARSARNQAGGGTGRGPGLLQVHRGAPRAVPDHPAGGVRLTRALRLHYTRIVNGYIEGLKAAQLSGEVREMDPTVAASALSWASAS